MHEVTELDSLGLMIGTGRCDASCRGCAGIPHRPYAPRSDGDDDFRRIEEAIRECHRRGARRITLSSSGEPTLSPISVSKALALIGRLRREGLGFDRVSMYTNGIRIGEDRLWSAAWLPHWRVQGLDTVYLSLHSIDQRENSEGFGVECPPIQRISDRLDDAGLKKRACLILRRGRVDDEKSLARTVRLLEQLGFEQLTAWPLRDAQDRLHRDAPSDQQLSEMATWAFTTNRWGTMRVDVHDEGDREQRYSRKLTLFPDGRLASAWTR